MKLLIKQEELKNYKSRDKIPIECEICHNTFYKPKNDVLWAYKRKSANCLRVCSIKCRTILSDKKENIPCSFCKKLKKHKQSIIKKYKLLFCSNSCKGKYWNSHKNWDGRRAKLEKWLEEQFIKLYPNLKIEYNKTDTINSELDIYIPSLKLAFELNGIFHYEPIFGKEKLQIKQNNDQRKFQACLEKNIELCIIDTSSQKYFKEKSSEKFLSIITEIINKKLAVN
jgi:hypothetical protein